MSVWLRAVAKSATRSPAEWAVLMAIAEHTPGPHRAAWPSVPRIAADTGLSVRHVRRCIGALRARGILRPAPDPDPLPGMPKTKARAYFIHVPGFTPA